MRVLSHSHFPLINSSCFQSKQRCFWLFYTLLGLLSMQVSWSFASDTRTAGYAWLYGCLMLLCRGLAFSKPKGSFNLKGCIPC